MPKTLAMLLADASELATQGLFSASSDVLTKAIKLAPKRQDLQIKKAWLDHQIGNDVAARLRLGNTKFVGNRAIEAAILIMEIDAKNKIDATRNQADIEKANYASDLLLKCVPWAELHERFVAACRDLNLLNLLLTFLKSWLHQHGVSKKVLVRASEVLLELDQPISAYKMLNYIWEQPEVQSEMTLLLGARTIVPEDNAREDQKILDKIDRTFDLKEEKLSHIELVEGSIDPCSVSVLFVGSKIVGAGLERNNDLAAHYESTSRLVGINFCTALDTNLVVPQWNRASDEQVEEAILKFKKILADKRPDILILDACTLPTGRGLTPNLLKELKDKYHFRVAGLLRDPLKVAQLNIEAWAEVSDTLISGDPTAFFVKESSCKLNRLALFLPVPAFHQPFYPSLTPAINDLLFVGSTFGIHRSMLISMLGASDIPINLVIGPKRKKIAPDEGSYAKLLKSSRGVLNISAHHPSANGHLVTGRIWEVIACQSLLFEQRNPGTESFFQPWRHFLPWEKPADIIHYWRVISRHDAYRVRIAKAAYDWVQRHYNPYLFWSALIGHVLRDRIK